MNKICTSIEQSKKLLELGIDAKTADMCWQNNEFPIGFNDEDAVPAWSLSALLGVMPFIKLEDSNIDSDPMIIKSPNGEYFCSYDSDDYYLSKSGKNAIDAAFEMIIELKEKQLL